jgi:uncharacterized damage-inducible protein DinB
MSIATTTQHLLISTPDAAALSAYYQTYLGEYSGIDMIKDLVDQRQSTHHFLLSIPHEKETYRYTEGKWSIREVAGHVCDTERILSYRALRISRNDKTSLPGFDENLYTPQANYNERTLKNISEELIAVRNASIALFSNMGMEMFDRSGTANDEAVSARGLLFFILAHQFHHLNVIRKKYL